MLGGDLNGLVPPHVISYLNRRLAELGDGIGSKVRPVSVRETE
jgi:hypothetical protein